MRCNLILAFFRGLLIFRAVNYAPLFSATLCEIMVSHGLTQVEAEKVSGLGRNILARLSSGEQWPHCDHIAGVAKLATEEERVRLANAIGSDCAGAAGVNRFAVAEDAGVVMLRVPRNLVSLIEDAMLLAQCNPTGAIALRGVIDSLLPGVVHTEALRLDISDLRNEQPTPKKQRKNTGAPTASRVLPPKPKAS